MGADSEQKLTAGRTGGADEESDLLPDTIQPFGFLIAVSQDWLVSSASTNTEHHLGIPPGDMVGKPLKEFFQPETVHAIRNRMMLLRDPESSERLFSITLRSDRPAFATTVHFAGRSVVIEAEPAAGSDGEAGNMVRSMIGRLEKAGSMASFLHEAARHVRALTGFDRVVLYGFHGSGGLVAAEASRAGSESLLGHAIPEWALTAVRVSCLRNRLRILADIDAAPVPLVAENHASAALIDPSLCVLRSPSPGETEYMRGHRIGASFFIPVIVDGRAWGLFACHHQKSRLPNFVQREAAEQFAQMFALMLNGREVQEQLNAQNAGFARRMESTLARVRDLVAETRRDALSMDAFADSLDRRIAALAQEQWPD